MKVLRGDIVLVELPFANQPGSKIRPALVVQADSHNTRLTNTIVAAITTNVSRSGREPTHVLIDITTVMGKNSGLLTTSVVTCENLFTLGKNRILRKIGQLGEPLLGSVNKGLKLSLGLS